MKGHPPILIVGLPRSGTTWIGAVLSSAPGTAYLFEPDNEGLSPVAWLCKRSLHRFPYLAVDDLADDYQHLWATTLTGPRWMWLANSALGQLLRRKAFEVEAGIGEKCGLVYVDERMHRVGRPGQVQPYRVDSHPITARLSRLLTAANWEARQGARRIIKSVHASLSLEWIAGRFPVEIVVVLRNPFSLVASYKRMRLPDSYRNLPVQDNLLRDWSQYLPTGSRVARPEPVDQMAFQIMLMYRIIERQCGAHPEWTLLSHDRLCIAPEPGYGSVFRMLGLHWTGDTDRKISELGGAGERFSPRRIAAQEPSKWKGELTPEEQHSIEHWIDAFDLSDFFEENVYIQE